MTIERITHSGGWQATATVDGYLFIRTFYGYTKREVATLFRAELVKLKKRGVK